MMGLFKANASVWIFLNHWVSICTAPVYHMNLIYDRYKGSILARSVGLLFNTLLTHLNFTLTHMYHPFNPVDDTLQVIIRCPQERANSTPHVVLP